MSGQTGRRPSTMRDVATAAGVSLATVSRVLSGDRPTDDDIAVRVRNAAALDVWPAPSAQELRKPVSAIGVVVPDLANPYFAEVLKGVSASAEEAGQRMLVADAHEDPAEEVRRAYELTRWSSGIICSPRMRPRDLAEVYGAEHLLTRRAVGPAVGQRLVDRIGWWQQYVATSGGSLDDNPSSGNKAGGLTTNREKSLGAVAKGGHSHPAAVHEHAEPVTTRSFVFMDTPGHDPVSATGMVAGGATVLCFTTGRGSVFGCKPTPSIKLATNSDTYRHVGGVM